MCVSRVGAVRLCLAAALVPSSTQVVERRLGPEKSPPGLITRQLCEHLSLPDEFVIPWLPNIEPLDCNSNIPSNNGPSRYQGPLRHAD
jgi:hypothetical protein